MSEKSGYLIKSVAKSFKVLEAFKDKREQGTTDLASKLNIPKSTIYNILFTFEKLGYLEQTENDKYRLSPKIFGISQTIEYDLRNEAKPFLNKLAEETNETINLVLHTDDKVLYTEKVESTEPININTKVGKKEDIYCTAVGKAILANLKKEKQNKLFKKIEFTPHTPNTITSVVKLREELSKIIELGYAIDNEEFAIGVKCIAAPIFNHKSVPISAISITGPVDRINSKGEKNLASLVKHYAKKISKNLGYNF